MTFKIWGQLEARETAVTPFSAISLQGFVHTIDTLAELLGVFLYMTLNALIACFCF